MARALGGIAKGLGRVLDGFGKSLQASTAPIEQLCKHQSLMALGKKSPAVHSDTFVASSAAVIGDVSIGRKSSVWFGSVVRGEDNGRVEIGANSSVLDRAVICSTGKTVIGNNVTIGHGAVLQTCSVGDNAVIGVGSILLEGSEVGKVSIVGAASVVAPNTKIPSGQVWAGNPAVFVRNVKAEEIQKIEEDVKLNTTISQLHLQETAKNVDEIEDDKEYREFQKKRDTDYESSWGLLEKNPRAQIW